MNSPSTQRLLHWEPNVHVLPVTKHNLSHIHNGCSLEHGSITDLKSSASSLKSTVFMCAGFHFNSAGQVPAAYGTMTCQRPRNKQYNGGLSLVAIKPRSGLEWKRGRLFHVAVRQLRGWRFKRQVCRRHSIKISTDIFWEIGQWKQRPWSATARRSPGQAWSEKCGQRSYPPGN